jgi:hypothetical protein
MVVMAGWCWRWSMPVGGGEQGPLVAGKGDPLGAAGPGGDLAGVSAYMAYVETQEVAAFCGRLATVTPCRRANTPVSSHLAHWHLGACRLWPILVLWAWPRLRQDDLAKVALQTPLWHARGCVLFSL